MNISGFYIIDKKEKPSLESQKLEIRHLLDHLVSYPCQGRLSRCFAGLSKSLIWMLQSK